MSALKRKLFIITLLAGTFTMSISQSALSTAYPTLMSAFGVGTDTIQWLTTGFMLMMCIMMPVSPWLLHNVSFKTIFLAVVGCFGLGTLLIILSPNFLVALLGRLLEAAAVGVLFPSFQAVLLSITPVADRSQVMGVAGLVMGSALACGPIISGIILNYVSWQGLFWFFLAVAVVVFGAGLKTMADVIAREPYALDWLSVLLSVGWVIVLYCLNELKTAITSGLLGLLVLGVVVSAAFVVRQLRRQNPLLQLRTLKTPAFVSGVLLTGISYMTLIVTTVISPLFYQEVLHQSALVSGLALVLPAVGLSLLNPYSGKLAAKVGFKPVLVGGMVVILLGWIGLLITLPHLNLVTMMLWAIVLEGGNAFVMMPATTLGANALPKKLLADGTAITTTARQLLGSLGVMVAMMLLQTNHQSAATIGGYQQVASFFVGLAVVGSIFAITIKNTKRQ